MDALGDELRSVGRVESEGRFTLDASRALGKLAVGEPARYGLHLVEAAVLSGASRLDLWRTRGGIEVSWDSEAIPAVDDLLVPTRWNPDAPEHPLGLALLHLLHAGATVELQTPVFLARFRGRSAQVEERAGPAGIRLRIRGWPKGGIPFWRPLPERAHLDRECAWAPLALTVDNRPVTLGPVQLPAGIYLFFHDSSVRQPLCRRVPHSLGPFSGAVGLVQQLRTPPLQLVVAGRLHARSEDLGPGVAAWVSTTRLPMDLTRSGLQESQQLSELVSVLREGARQLRVHMGDVWPEFSMEMQPLLVPHLHWHARELLREGDQHRALRALTHLDAWWAASAPVGAEAARYRLALLRMGEDPAAAAQDARPALVARAARSGCTVAPLDRQAPLWQRFEARGKPEGIRDLHAWMLAVEEEFLGEEDPSVTAHRAALDAYCRRNGVAATPISFPRDVLGLPPEPGQSASWPGARWHV